MSSLLLACSAESSSPLKSFSTGSLCHGIEAPHSFFCSRSANEAEYPCDVALCFLGITTGSLLLLLTFVVVTEQDGD